MNIENKKGKKDIVRIVHDKELTVRNALYSKIGADGEGFVSTCMSVKLELIK